MMAFIKTALLASSFALFAFAGGGIAFAAPPVSEVDKTFVAKVSQGGMYEVELGKVVENQGLAQDIKDSGTTEMHDHTIVGDRLKVAAGKAGIEFPGTLNVDFKARLAKLSAMSGTEFDRAYIADMKAIHAADGAAFLKEATGGSNSALKAFAAETFDIVQRHIGELDARTSELK